MSPPLREGEWVRLSLSRTLVQKPLRSKSSTVGKALQVFLPSSLQRPWWLWSYWDFSNRRTSWSRGWGDRFECCLERE